MNIQTGNNAMEEILTLSKKEKNVKQKKRYDAILFYLEGYSCSEIAGLLHVSRRSVSDYISAYKKGGVDALLIKKQPGRQKKLTDQQEKELFDIISTSTPQEAGVGIFANWTAPLACRLVSQRFHVDFSERGMRDLFYRIGLSYTRPTYTLEKADPEKQEAFREEWEVLKKTP